jgi:hypothetical protein
LIPTDTEIEAAIERLPFIPNELRAKQAARIVGWLFPQIRKWSMSWSRQTGDQMFRFSEELSQEGAVAILEVLKEHGQCQKHVDRWMGFLYRVGQNAAHRFIKSSAVQPLSGLVNHERRLARLSHTLSIVRHELGREPSPEELVGRHNSEMHHRRANPKKQGALITLADAAAVLRR